MVACPKLSCHRWRYERAKEMISHSFACGPINSKQPCHADLDFDGNRTHIDSRFHHSHAYIRRPHVRR
ncbi:hypothetical protein MTBSS4_50001 [Magnetospirillum sp. SS-4]|nr:hypothetical protein MTBSS4_50001 [Magnetospirillum sp. SS-4]